jgi:hypothetical protein
MPKTMSIKLSDFTQQIQSLSVSQLRGLDAILSNLANHIHDIGEYISELQKELKGLNTKQKKKELAEIILLEKQFVTVFNLLYKMNYDSHYMDRAQHILGSVRNDIKELKTELRKV